MIDIKKYIDTKTVIHCETEQESFEINKLIVELGGKSLHHYYNTYKNFTCYNLEDLKSWNTFENLNYFQKKGFTILKAKDILTETFTHKFKSGLEVKGTKEEIRLIAKAIGESLFPIYRSFTKGDIPVDEMHETHLRNAILLHLREYFTQKNFKNMDNESFLDNLEVQNFPETIEMLINELNRRINERN